MATEAMVLHDFEALQAQGQAAFEAGRLEESIELLERGLQWAEQDGDSRQVDLAFCNLASARISRGERVPLELASTKRLREILVANQDPANCRLAAYNLARAFEYKKDGKKGLFYARIALDRAEVLRRPDWIASSHNQIGNFLLADSYFDRAAAEYERALELLPSSAEHGRSLALLNLGYSEVVRGAVRKGVGLLYQSLRMLRHLQDPTNLAMNHADLCYAFVELGRLAVAVRHGSRALRLAEEGGAVDQIKNALYLLGTAFSQAGERARAGEYFAELQQRFYPSSPFVPELLLNVDVRRMINLRAA